MERPLSKTERRIFADVQDENRAWRLQSAAAHCLLDDAGVTERGAGLHIRIAALIRMNTAAPELLEALEGLVGWAEGDDVAPEGTLQRRLMVAKTAIAKARGK